MDVIFNWLAILGLTGACFRGDDEDYEGDNMAAGSGTGESGRSREEDGTVTVMACAWLLLWVGSEEETDGCMQDSLGWLQRF
jgi:hypothetical protein